MTTTDSLIERLGSDRRNDRRRAVIPGAAVVFDGRTFALRNLSAGGFLCVNYHGTRAVGDRIDVKLIAAPELDSRHDFLLEAEVVRCEPDARRLAARFVKVRGESSARFRAFFARHPDPSH